MFNSRNNEIPCQLNSSLQQALSRYTTEASRDAPVLTQGLNSLRGGIRCYSPCVLDKTEWENFYQAYPVDYDIRNDRCFDLHRSTYNRLMDIGAPVPEPTTSEGLRTGYCGPDELSCSKRPAFVRHLDKRPEPAYRLHLSDRTSLHYMRSDPFEGVLPFGRPGDMYDAKGVSHRDYKWRALCCDTRPKHQTMEREVHRRAKTDLHGRQNLCEIVKFEDDNPERYFKDRLMRLKKAYVWPVNPITGDPVGGSLSYYHHDPCRPERDEVWPCGEKATLEECPIRMPNDRCRIFAHYPKNIPRTKERHFENKSYLDMRYPIRNYECWEEVPRDQCVKPEDFPHECCWVDREGVQERVNEKKPCSC